MKASDNEPLIPERTGIPVPRLTASLAWVVVACVLLLAFALLGLVARTSNGPPVNAFMTNPAKLGGYDAYEILIALLPLGAIGMIWFALSAGAPKRAFLWCAAMILTVDWFVGAATLPFVNHTSSPAFLKDSYPNARSVVGLIAFAGWLLLAIRSTIGPVWKRTVGGLTAAGLIVALIAPVALGRARVVDAAGSLLLGAACWCLGVFIAERFGIRLFLNSDSEAD